MEKNPFLFIVGFIVASIILTWIGKIHPKRFFTFKQTILLIPVLIIVGSFLLSHNLPNSGIGFWILFVIGLALVFMLNHDRWRSSDKK